MRLLDKIRERNKKKLEAIQEAEVRIEIHKCNEAKKAFNEAEAANQRALIRDRRQMIRLIELLDIYSRKLLDIKAHSKDIMATAQRILTNLARKRDGNTQKPDDFLSTGEKRVIDFCAEINEQIKKLTEFVNERIDNLENHRKARDTIGISKDDMNNIWNGIDRLQRKLTELFNLEKEIKSTSQN